MINNWYQTKKTFALQKVREEIDRKGRQSYHVRTYVGLMHDGAQGQDQVFFFLFLGQRRKEELN